MKSNVLVVEDNPELRRLLNEGLEEEGFEVDLARDGREALMLADSRKHDLLVIDIGLPDSDGRDVCQALKSNGVDAPVLFLTARDSGPDRVSGFSAGGDDYLTKPFVFAELVARLRVLARRSTQVDRTTAGDLRLDPVKHVLVCRDDQAELTPTEFRLTGAMIARSGEVIRRREMISAAWPPGAIVHDNTVDVYVRRLRKKLETLDSETRIHTVHGVGYRLE
ncbi:MAG: response regulator transcription factor [Solirubrobacterales bacterium]|nr:response regulator transcription factor [Solirubrobacterales bacterium]MCB0859159.1 response regulator transcription factor [Solirubrobacterales bacterium]